jgi:hypothetical protein
MALFNMFDKKKKSKSNAPKHLTSSFVKTTSNVPKLLRAVAKEYNIVPSSMDFDLLRVSTEVKFPNESDYKELDEVVREELYKNEMLLNPELFIRQVYDINIRPMVKRKDFILNMDIKINNTYSMAEGIVRKDSLLEYSEDLKSHILDEINKRKIKSGIFIDLFDEQMLEDISKMVMKIRINESLQEDYFIQLCEWIEPRLSEDDGLILHYKDEVAKPNEHDQVNYAERNFIHSVSEDELLIEYLHVQTGRDGRNFRGEYVPLREPIIAHHPTFIIDPETILTTSNNRRTLYYAKRDGFILHTSKQLSVGEELDIENADFKSTGNIHASLDKNIKINMSTKDTGSDQVGQNLVVETDELNVGGSVANGAKIIANKVVIGGQTHKTAKIFAKDVEVNIHRGYIEGAKVHITRLEHGEVVGDEVHVTQMIGGTVRARKIVVDVVGSHATLIASHEIIISSELRGNDNQFIIEPAVSLADREKLELLKDEFIELEKESAYQEREFVKKRRVLQANSESGEKIKKKLLEDKREGRKSSIILINKYKQYTKFLQDLKNMQTSLAEAKEAYEVVKDNITVLQDTTMSARIVSEDGWHGHNEVVFRLIHPKVEERLIPKDALARTVSFAMIGDDEYEILLAP